MGYLSTQYEIVPAGDFFVVDTQNVGHNSQDLKSIINAIQSSESGIQSDISDIVTRVTTAEGNISSLDTKISTAEGNISSLDTRVTALEEGGGGGGDYPPETGIPEEDLSDDVKQKLNRDLGTQCLYEIDGTTLNITILESGLGTQCNFNLEGNILNISTLGSGSSA